MNIHETIIHVTGAMIHATGILKQSTHVYRWIYV